MTLPGRMTVQEVLLNLKRHQPSGMCENLLFNVASYQGLGDTKRFGPFLG
jgi:hypothetical protein